MRIEVFYKEPRQDGRLRHIRDILVTAGLDNALPCLLVDVYFVEVPGWEAFLTRQRLPALFSDTVAQNLLVDQPAAARADVKKWQTLIEVCANPGVADPVATTIAELLQSVADKPLPSEARLQTARQYLFANADPDKRFDGNAVAGRLVNQLIQRHAIIEKEDWLKGARPPKFWPSEVKPSPARVERFPLAELNSEELRVFSEKRLLALNDAEMAAAQAYYRRKEVIAQRKALGLSPSATDVEIEMIAQTWSEHCKHKIFKAVINYREGDKSVVIDSLFKTYIQSVTDKLRTERPFLRSVFTDNAGIIRFNDSHLLCFKAETHNSPSALDPYGGAITGILGVNRDIIGAGLGAKPIFNTNVLCFGYPDAPSSELPAGLLPPARVLQGVRQGIIDGGNQSGIPTVAGAFLFDAGYRGKPLVFCGTGGLLPAKIGNQDAWQKSIDPGDLAVMAGGRIGKDGIHGATFSSLALDEDSPLSAVQIGDAFTQKKLLDFILEARDLELYHCITDNGAGGLSSSLGEMAEYSGGLKLDLDKCPLKYPGLAAWEILVSESQERMSLAVKPRNWPAVVELARKRQVEVTAIGEFTDSGRIEVLFKNQIVAALDIEFLHNGLPTLRLNAHWQPPPTQTVELPPDSQARSWWLKLLADPNIASKEKLVRQYDHEVQAQSVIKPFVGLFGDGPADGAVLKPLADENRGIVITHGICPAYSAIDTHSMAQAAVDEALRGLVACGGDPEQAVILDNFCWPDPVASPQTPDGEFKLAQLVRACRGLAEICLSYKLPLISGKDSMKNDTQLADQKISILPTLLISLLGFIPDYRAALSTDFKKPGDIVYLAGRNNGELGGSRFNALRQTEAGQAPNVENSQDQFTCYRALHQAACARLLSSAHDLSDGGLAVAAAESAFGGRLGADLSLDNLPGRDTDKQPLIRLLFAESPGRLLLSVPPAKETAFLKSMDGCPLARMGEVKQKERLTFWRNQKKAASLTLTEIGRAWKKEGLLW